MKHCLFFFILSILGVSTVSASWQRSVTNYFRHEYRSGNQNWMIDQHENGWIYLANNKGLLEFDGVEWNTYSIHNAKTRAVKIGNDGQVYIGGMGQFGYFIPNNLGGLDYTCLSDSVDQNTDIGVIWNIHIVDNLIYFQSEWNIFCLEKGQIKVIKSPGVIKYSAIIHNKFYIATGNGLAVLNGDEISPLVNTEILAQYKVAALLPLGDKILAVTSRNGLFVYDGTSMNAYSSSADAFIQKNLLFCAGIKDSLLALGSVQDGVLLLNLKTNWAEKISIGNGLQNKTVLGLFFDRDNNLWLGLDNGIDCVHLEAPLFSLFGNKAVIGSGYSSCCYGGKLYLGTNQGLYRTDIPARMNETIEMDFVPGTEGQVWSLYEYDNKLFCCADNGIFVQDGSVLYNINSPKGVWRVVQFRHRPDVMIAGTYSGMYLLRKETNGKWVMNHRIEGFNHSCKTLFVESPNTLWIANKGKGIFRIVLSDALDKVVKSKNYNNTDLPANNDAFVTRINGEVVVASHNGLFRYDQIKDQLEKFQSLEALLEGDTKYTYLAQGPLGDIWYVADGMLKLLRYDASTKTYYKNKNEIYLRESLIDNFEYVHFCDNGQAVIGTEEGFSLLRYKRKPTGQQLNLQIRKVYLTGIKDSLIYGRSYHYDEKPVLISYSNNSLRIQYSVTNYDESSTAFYSCRLSGSKDDSWSAYSENNAKEYTDLREGKYTFYVKLITDKDKNPIVTSFVFEILPPWYRAWWAYSIYVVMMSICLFYIYYRIAQSRKRLIRQKEQELIRQKKEFEKESNLKDKKIDDLKEENLRSELRYKSEELIRSTLNIVHKNEILQEIRRGAMSISHSVNEENLVGIRRKTLHLIGRIDKDLENEDYWQAFQTSFDSVHHDFFQYLDEHFPGLNHKEKILCAYLRMNLMSKEIAPLLNISVRGVEISRYRLRKKLGVEEKDNLADFLQRLC